MFCGHCGTWVAEDQTACARCGAALSGDQVLRGGPAAPTGTPLSGAGESPRPASPPTRLDLPFRYGGFWRRLAATLVDALLLFFPDAILRVSLGLPVARTGFETIPDEQAFAELAANLFQFVLGWLYSALLMSSSREATLGQQLLDLRTTDVHGARLGFGRASGRYLAQILSVLTCGIGYLALLWTKRRQALHDLIAGTVVLRGEPGPGEATTAAGPPA